MLKNQIPEAFHPGEFIREEMEARGWAQVDLAMILGCKPNVVNDLLSGRRSITPETAHDLSEAFGTSADYWINLQSKYDLAMASTRSDDIARKAKLYSKAPIREMQKRGWIEETNNLDILEAQLCRLFGIGTIDENPNLRIAARMSDNYSGVSTAQLAWLSRAKQIASALEVTGEFIQDNLDTLFEKLRELLDEILSLKDVSDLLSCYGIRFVILEHLPGTKIDGACVWLDDNSPCAVVSLRMNRIDHFWFTLLHELAHIRQGDGKKIPVLDSDLITEQSSGENKPSFEKQADKFAASFLINSEELVDFINRKSPAFSKSNITNFAHRIGVHPGIVVGRLQYMGILPYRNLRALLEKVKDVLIQSAPTDGWGIVFRV